MSLTIGLTYDLRSAYLAEGYSEEETAEFDQEATIEAIEGARHDVFLSDADARYRAIEVLDDWLDRLPA